MKRLPLLVAEDPPDAFPPVEEAMEDPPGLLAAGGDLSVDRLLQAYRLGIFPWYEEGQPILWWTPEPRAVLFPENLKVSRSLNKTLRARRFTITMDQAFHSVIQLCAEHRPGQNGTWITQEMTQAYIALYRTGHAHSVEAWLDNTLVGGLYGVSIGKVFFGESMFSLVSDASKVAFVHLVKQLEAWSFPVIDCQIESSHLNSLGSHTISRREFSNLLKKHCSLPHPVGAWTPD